MSDVPRRRLLNAGPWIRSTRSDRAGLGGPGAGGRQRSRSIPQPQPNALPSTPASTSGSVRRRRRPQTREVERLVSLGTQRVGWDLYPPDADFVVLADPGGNRFCVINAGAAEGRMITP